MAVIIFSQIGELKSPASLTDSSIEIWLRRPRSFMVSFLIIVLSKHNTESHSFCRNATTFPPRLISSSQSVSANTALCGVKRISRLDIISALQIWNETCLFTLCKSQYSSFKMHKNTQRPLQLDSWVNFSLQSLEISDREAEVSSNWAAL